MWLSLSLAIIAFQLFFEKKFFYSTKDWLIDWLIDWLDSGLHRIHMTADLFVCLFGVYRPTRAFFGVNALTYCAPPRFTTAEGISITLKRSTNSQHTSIGHALILDCMSKVRNIDCLSRNHSKYYYDSISFWFFTILTYKIVEVRHSILLITFFPGKITNTLKSVQLISQHSWV